MTMTTTEMVPTGKQELIESLTEMVLATCVSAHTRRAYAFGLRGFLKSGYPLTREGVALHVQEKRAAGAQNGTVLSLLAAVRKLALEAQLRGLITFEEMHNIKSIRSGKADLAKSGMWLTIAQVRILLGLPDRETYYGKRDACILSLMVGCGLRRQEMSDLPWEKYQEREGRMCLVDVKGKGNKRRTLPVPLWAQPDVDAWFLASREAPVGLKGVYKAHAAHIKADDTKVTGGLGYDGISDMVALYGERMGVNLNPHDLRRTLAQMLRRNGAPLEQIQATLGHARLETTNVYLGSCLELAPGKSSVDHLDIHRGHAVNLKPSPKVVPFRAGEAQDATGGAR